MMPIDAPIIAKGGHNPEAKGAIEMATAHAIVPIPAAIWSTNMSFLSLSPVTVVPRTQDVPFHSLILLGIMNP
jgi:hypothetical protein